MTSGRAGPAAVATVDVTALLTGAGIGVFAHAVTTYMRQTCAAPSDPGSMCELAVIFWGPAVAVGTALFAGFVIWPVLSIAGIEPRRRVLIGAFLLPVVLVEPFGFAAWVPAPPVLVTALTSGIAQAWIAFTAGVSRPGR